MTTVCSQDINASDIQSLNSFDSSFQGNYQINNINKIS